MEIPASLLGFSVAGDLDGLTLYTMRSGIKIAYAKSPPDCPPTIAQQIQRARFAAAMRFWSLLSTGDKACWMSCADKLNPGMLGQNLFVYMAFHQDWNLLFTIIGQCLCDLAMPPNVNDL